MIKHGTIIPLIGGMTIGQSQAFGSKPDTLISYTPFANNDQHCRAYYPDTPYVVLNETGSLPKLKLDVVSSVCPCAGLSSLSPSASSSAPVNDWLITAVKYILEEVKPEVYYGENAPRFGSKLGEPVVAKMRAIGEAAGYSMMIYKTKSILHGLSQVRDRTFYFFFKGDKIPFFPFFQREHELIENTIRNGGSEDPSDPMNVLTNAKIPSQEPYYRFVLEKLEGGISHRKFWEKIPASTNPLDYIEASGTTYAEVAEWMKEKGYSEKIQARLIRMGEKLKGGGNIMRKTTEIPKGHIGAFVGHAPNNMTHPDFDRFLTVRECLTIMGMPRDFQLLGGMKNLNHICQNVPVTTAHDMASCVKEYLDGKIAESINARFAIIDNKTRTRYSPDCAPPSSLAAFWQ